MTAADLEDDWFEPPKVRPSDMPSRVIETTRWDDQAVDQLRKDFPQFRRDGQKLADAVDFGASLWEDAHFSYSKVVPRKRDAEDIRPAARLNRTIMDVVMATPEHENLRAAGTTEDPVSAAMATMATREALEDIAGRLKEQQQRMADAERQMEELQQRQQDPDADQEEIEDQMQAVQQLISTAEDEAKEIVQGRVPEIKKALGEAADDLEAQESAARAYGTEPGALRKMSAKERIRFAKRLDNPKLRQIADLVGPVMRTMWGAQREQLNMSPDEVHSLTTGDDLSRVLPSELALLGDPVRKWDFYRRLTEGLLLSHEFRGSEKIGKGGILALLDSSGSMFYPTMAPEVWAKSVAIAFLNLARSQKREFHSCLFGSDSDDLITMSFTKPEDFTTERLIKLAEDAIEGGTSWQKPLDWAMKTLSRQHAQDGKVQADIVLITDGECDVDDKWLERYRAEKARLGFRTYACGILLSQPWQLEALRKVSDVVWTVDCLVSGEGLRDLFSRINAYVQKERSDA